MCLSVRSLSIALLRFLMFYHASPITFVFVFQTKINKLVIRLSWKDSAWDNYSVFFEYNSPNRSKRKIFRLIRYIRHQRKEESVRMRTRKGVEPLHTSQIGNRRLLLKWTILILMRETTTHYLFGDHFWPFSQLYIDFLFKNQRKNRIIPLCFEVGFEPLRATLATFLSPAVIPPALFAVNLG